MEIDRIVEEEKEKMIAEFEGKNSQEDEMEIDIMKEAKIEAEIEKMKLNIEKDENFHPHRIQRMGKTPTKTSDSAFAIGTNQIADDVSGLIPRRQRVEAGWHVSDSHFKKGSSVALRNFEDEPSEPEKVNFKKETNEELVNRVMEKVHQRLESQKRTIERENKLGWTLENPERKNIEILDSFDLLRELNRSLQEPLAATQQLINRSLMFHLFEVERLRPYLGGLRCLLLFQDGVYTNALSDSIFPLVENNFEGGPPLLHQIIQKSKSSVIELDAIETVKYLRLAFSRNDNNISTPLQNLRNIKLYFASKWPFNVIVDEKMMEIYTSVSSFLLSLLYARWKLDAIWIQRGIPKNQQMHEIQLIRCEMVQFLRGFSNFVFQSIIAAQWFSFVQRITEFNDKNELDLDRLYTEHQNYLIAIENQCLLSRDMKPFQRNINNLISLIVQFSHLYQKIRNNIDDSEAVDRAKKCGADFRRTVKIFLEVTRKIAASGVSNSLCGLIQSIDFDEFYT